MLEKRGVVYQDNRDVRIQRSGLSGLKSWQNIEKYFIRTIEMVEYKRVVHHGCRDGRIQRSSNYQDNRDGRLLRNSSSGL